MTSPADQLVSHRSLEGKGLIAAGLVGLPIGLVAVGFQELVAWAAWLTLDVLSPWGRSGLGAGAGLLVLTTGLAAAAGWITERFAPEAAGSGIPHVKAVLIGVRDMRPWRVIPVKIGAGLLALGSGMSLGREGPTIQVGAAIASWVADLAKAPIRLRQALVGSGAGAGLAAAFNAPLSGFIFVMEEMRRELSPLTYGMALAASVAAVAAARLLLGQNPSFLLSEAAPLPLRALPLAALLGVLAGLVGVLFNRITLALIRRVARWKVPRWAAAGAMGLIAGAVLLTLPAATGGGHHLIETLLTGESASTLGLLALLLVVKLLLTAGSFASGVPGGIFAPLLAQGALLGSVFGLGVQAVWPAAGVPVPVFAVLGMASVLAGSIRAPLTGVVLIVEMTHQYSLLYALLVAGFAGYLTANLLRNTPIYEALLERELHRSGLTPPDPAEARVLELVIDPDSAWDGRAIRDLGLPQGCLISAIRRENRFVAPRGDTVLQFGDEATLFVVEGTTDRELAAIVDATTSPHPAID